MKIASVADVKAKLSSYVKDSARSPVLITRNGKAVAAIVPIAEEDDVERIMLSHSPRLRAILSSARKRVKAGSAVPHQDFWRRVAGGKVRGK